MFVFCFIVVIVYFLDLTSQGLMQNCNQMHACYLFQQDKHYDLSYDTGDKALQCGRHVDIFKLWLMWRAKVRKNMEMSSLAHISLLSKAIHRKYFSVKVKHATYKIYLISLELNYPGPNPYIQVFDI